MKMTKKILGILLCCVMLMGLLPISAFAAAGDQNEPINANGMWFGYGVDCYLLNPTLAAGDEDGLWYTFTAEDAGILQLEHSRKDVDYQVIMWVNGVEYKAYDGDIYSRPITTYPLAKGDVATINIKTEGAAAGSVYANIKIITGENNPNQTVKMKAAGAKVYVAAGQTVYYQDDSTAAVYATKGLVVSGDSVDGITVTSILSDTVSKVYTDTDGDDTVELKLGGSLGGAGAPPVKPKWSITNDSAEDRCFILTVTDDAHECVYDDDTDVDCNTCGTIRELPTCEHEYDHDFDADCNECGDVREVVIAITFGGNSVSEDVNGLAFKFDLAAAGIAVVEGNKADLSNAYVGQHKLVKMGAVVSNDNSSVDIEAVYLWELQEDLASYYVRIINIPNTCKDADITAVPYFIFEVNGAEITIEGEAQTATFNSELG